MAERYIPRYRLPGQQRELNCPVLLAAGALLEDTQKPRLVGQLKLQNLSGKTISQLYVSVRCGGGEPVIFRYHGLAAGPGQVFGQYTALTLPFSDARTLQAEIRRVEFADGSHWNLAAAQRRAEEWELARREEAERRDAERQKAIQEAEAKAAARKAAAEEKARRKQEAAQAKPAQTAPDAAVQESAPAETAPAKKTGVGKWLLPAAAAVVALVAGVLLVPRLLNGGSFENDGDSANGSFSIVVPSSSPTGGGGSPGNNSPTAGPADGPGDGPSAAPVDGPGAGVENVPTAGDSVMTIYLEKSERGYFDLSVDALSPYLPEGSTFCTAYTPNLGSNIDEYIKDSFTFAALFRWPGLSSDQMRLSDERSSIALLVFEEDDGLWLTGYFVGNPTRYNDNTLRLDVTPCRYDITSLAAKELTAFYGNRDFLYENYIAPENVANSGAAWYLRGYYTGQSPDPREDDCQMYHLWSEATSPYKERFCRPINEFGAVVPDTERWVCCLLLDKNYELLGYTMLGG